jgi:hypothetical protein
MNNELERYRRKWSQPNFMYYPGIFLERLRTTTKNFSYDSRYPDRDYNPSTEQDC